MDIALLVLVALAIPACAIAGFVMALGLRRRADAIERRLALLEARLAMPPPDRTAAAGVGIPEAPEPAPAEAEFLPSDEEAPGPELQEPVPAGPSPGAPPARPAAGFEERLGARWAVWIGGLALAFGGLFLVRYSIEQDLIGPGGRVAAGALLALALIGVGEWLRRRETATGFAGLPAAHVPGVLTAAGTSTAFASAYAAHALYGLIGPGPAFALLGAIAVVTMIASALHGPALAALGLVAALASPLLVEADAPRLWPVVLYLAFVVAAAYGVARMRLWRWLALAAAAGAIAWALLLAAAAGPDILPLMAHVLGQTLLAGLLLVADPHRRTLDPDAHPDWFATGILLCFALIAVLVTLAPEAGSGRPVFAAAVALAMLALAVRFPPAAAGAAWAALVTAGTLASWPVAMQIAAEPPTVLPGPVGPTPRPQALGTYLAFATALPLAIAGASLWRAVRGRDLPLATAAWFAGAATLGPLAALVVAYWRVAAFERSISFALAAGVLAVAFTGVTARLRRPGREAMDALRLMLGAAAAAAVAALAAGLTFALDRGMLTVAFALSALGTAWVADRAAIPVLRHAAGALGLVVLGRLAWDPTIAGGDPGATPIVNWLLWGYGTPAAAFFLASRILERSGRDRIVRLTESLAIVFAALLAVFEIRHALQGGDPLAHTSDYLEMGLFATTALAFALVMVRVDARRPDVVSRVASLAFGAISLLLSGIGLGLAVNPVFGGEPVLGGALVNSLLVAYLLPALLASALAVAARGVRPRWYVLCAAGLGLALHLLYMVLEIRRLFQGPSIGLQRPTGEAELWAYSVALLLTGMALLAIGLWRNIRTARLVSAGYIVATVVKVFIVDLANLEGVMRALSFIGLGIALVGIGFAYQRLLARAAPPAPAGPG